MGKITHFGDRQQQGCETGHPADAGVLRVEPTGLAGISRLTNADMTVRELRQFAPLDLARIIPRLVAST